MSVKIRLKKLGRKKRPFYRIVAIDSRFKRDGREIERLGWYDPVQINHSCKLDEERVLHWLGQGAIPSETVKGLFRRAGLNYKWHLMNQGLKGLELDKLLEEWHKREENRIQLKKDKKIKKKELASSQKDNDATNQDLKAAPEAEEAPADEKVEAAPEAEEAPADEKVEAAPEAEEAPADEIKDLIKEEDLDQEDKSSKDKSE